ncbi:MAG: bifunctional 2-C-methyl-D-erythritol 4-phosphate cytidylyltransferase/2-C-methyl-D-erythritol 2,4-cyclodiphosphate synthase [Rubrimonas sp.]|uniref:bifunctional 2-C-methyl-D-erythritol 4-phosphate cytidylyltransferase/2-C-methyl-D-erythritol 2,4-cyclodiphosphate synthase n=1 Tax=Rubrimonas sp. TaxID=2036015 RepID=UPI002FDD324D
MRVSAVIVAAGKGVRAGDGPPKQYREVGGAAILARSMARFLDAPRVSDLCVAIRPEHRAFYDAATRALPAAKPIRVVEGGAERADSVLRALEALAGDPPDAVLIHDAARPFVSLRVIDSVIDALADAPGACAAIPIVDALRREEDGACGDLIPREGAWRAQTPQGFRFAPILAAHRANADPIAPDDAEIARRAGLRVALVESEADNFKITRPGDFARAERLIAAERAMETRIGSGFDVHAFGPGDHLMLCGVKVPHDRGFLAHSDGDVALHALTDAVLGALALGDIGRWFPPSDPQWKGAASDQFLRHALDLAQARGYRVGNLDVTVICERPKIGPHADAMRARIAEIACCAPERVNVKATTTERLGFTGRAEGIAAQAAAALVGPVAGHVE